MTASFTSQPQTSGFLGTDNANKDRIVQVGALQIGSTTLIEADVAALDSVSALVDQAVNATSIGAAATAPLVGSVATTVTRFGKFFTLDFVLTGAQIPVVDAVGSGSSGSLKLFEFAQGCINILGTRQDYTAFDESDLVTFTGDTTDTSAVVTNVSSIVGLYVGQFVSGTGIAALTRIASIDSATQVTLTIAATATNATTTITAPALTGGASGGDAAFLLALGSVAANAGDGALTGTEVDVAPATSTLTNTAGTTTGAKQSVTALLYDGTSTALSVFLNWSGSAATIDASGVIRVTGTITVVGVFMGDD